MHGIINNYKRVLIVEENLSGLLAKIIYGINPPANVFKVNKIGSMITPNEIIKEAERCLQIY